MSRCGCAGECACVVIGGDCITVAGSGNPGSPYSVSTLVDPDITNQLACGDPGLFVPPPSIEVADTDCVNLDGTGFPGDPVTATLILDPEDCNLLKCNPGQGLDVLLHTLDTDCIDLEGCGTLDSPLTAGIKISGDLGNIFDCRADGAYVPAAGVGAIIYEGEITLTGNQLVPAGTPDTSATIAFDSTDNDLGGIVDIANNGFLVPVGGAGWYLIWLGLVANSPDNGWAGPGQYQVIGEILVNGTPDTSNGLHSMDIVNDSSTYAYHLQVTSIPRYLSAGDTVKFEFFFRNVLAGLVGIQTISSFTTAKIIQVGV